MATNPRHALYDAAIEAGHKQEDPLPLWWPELAPLNANERRLVRKAVMLGAKPTDLVETEPAE
jgi:hypothetical protein